MSCAECCRDDETTEYWDPRTPPLLSGGCLCSSCARDAHELVMQEAYDAAVEALGVETANEIFDRRVR